MTEEQRKAYRGMGIAQRPYYLMQIGEAHSYEEAVRQIAARRSEWCRSQRDIAARNAARKAEAAQRVAAIYG